MNEVQVEIVDWESWGVQHMKALEDVDAKVGGPPVTWDIPTELLDEYGDGHFEPLTMIAASVSLAFLIKTISSVLSDHKRPGGQVVDARGEKVVLRPAPNLERGTLVVISAAGPKVIATKEKNEISNALIEAMTHG